MFSVTVCQSSLLAYGNPARQCPEEIVVYAVPFGILLVFGIIRLRQIADYPCVIMPRSVLQSVRVVASCAIICSLALVIIIHGLVQDDLGPYALVSNCMTLMGWLFATIIMSKEHSRALNQAWMIRAWWILQLLIGSLKLHAVICVKQVHPLYHNVVFTHAACVTSAIATKFEHRDHLNCSHVYIARRRWSASMCQYGQTPAIRSNSNSRAI